MRRRMAFLIVAMTCFLVFLIVLYACAENWVLLGSRTVALVSERDSIVVTASQGKFNAIRIQVRDRGVNFESLQIQFGDGQLMDVPVRAFIPAGGSTRVIDLPNPPRYINNITFYYKTRPGTLVPATIEVWGLTY